LTEATTQPIDKRDPDGNRAWVNHLLLWRLCGNAKCRRARACRGKVHLCARPNFYLLPQGVQDFYHGLADARNEGLSFEDAMERLDETGAVEAFEDWNVAVAASVMRYSPHTSEGR
jgi:hypothetical protein